MRRETITGMLNSLDDVYISEAAVFSPDAIQESPERIVRMKKKRIITFALAAALVLSLGIAAYAASLFGLRELYASPNRGDMPDEAADLIVSQNAKAESDGWSASVLESYCDEGTVLVTVRVSAESDYLLVPTDEDLDSPLWVIGLQGEGTLGDYARREGKTLLFAGATLDREALGLQSAGERFESTSPHEMTICVEGAREGGAVVPVDAVCTVVVVVCPPEMQTADSPVTERRELLITLAEGKSIPLGLYIPTDPHALPGFELGELSLTQSPLGISLRLKMSVLDEEAAKKLLTLRLDGVEFHGSGTIDPNGYAVFGQGQGDFGDSPVIRFLDWDKNSIAELSFEKIG